MKKLFIAVLVILLVAGYMFYMDNNNLAKLPKGVISYEYDLVKSFLIPIDNGEYLLFDTGYERNYKVFKELLKKDSIDVKKIKYIFISHHHDDHAGFINNLIKDNPEVRVILHEKTVPLMLLGENNLANGGGIVNPFVNLLFNIKQAISPEWDFTLPKYYVRDRDIVLTGDKADLKKILGEDIYMIYTPGHTSDSISLVYQNEYIFCGDLASNVLNWAGAKHLTLFNESLEDVYSSWGKVIDLDIDNIIPSHGKPFKLSSLEKNLDKYEQSDLVPYLSHR